MWNFLKTISGKNGVQLIDAFDEKQVLWGHKRLSLLSDTAEILWEREFDELYWVRNLSETLVLVQTVNEGSVFVVSKLNGETQNELIGAFSLSRAIETPAGFLIPLRGTEPGYSLISSDGDEVKTGLRGDLIFKFAYDSYAVTAYTTIIACYGVEDGVEKWTLKTTDLLYSADARVDVPFFMTVVKGTLLAVFPKHAAAFDLATGKVIWENNVSVNHQCIVDQDRLILLSGLNHLYTMDIATGQVTKEANLNIKNDRKQKGVDYPNLMNDVTKSNFVQDDKNLYFCLRSACKIVSVNKKTLSVVNATSITPEAPGEMFNYPIVLAGTRLFVPFTFKEGGLSHLVYNKIG